MPYADAAVTRILERLRAGAVVEHRTCGGRYIMTYAFKSGAWHVDDWQEGTSFVFHPTDEEMRELVADAPEGTFDALLRR